MRYRGRDVAEQRRRRRIARMRRDFDLAAACEHRERPPMGAVGEPAGPCPPAVIGPAHLSIAPAPAPTTGRGNIDERRSRRSPPSRRLGRCDEDTQSPYYPALTSACLTAPP